MLQCKQIIELTSQGMDTKLPWMTQLQVKMHVLLCNKCRQYAQQLSFIQHALFAMSEQVQSQKLPKAAKERIAKKLQQENLTKK